MLEPVVLDVGGLDIQVIASVLSPAAFARFGSVIQNPKPDLHPGSFTTSGHLPFSPVSANQGSAIKYQHVARMVNLYGQAPTGGCCGEAVMNMFVCAARKLNPPGVFRVTILERHPFTTQTFIPLSSHSAKTYLVIVAPSLPPTSADEGLPVPKSNVTSPAPNAQPSQIPLPGRGLPDLRNLKAFIATSEQAVTYGAGTWHAPMVALGPEGATLDFVVVQFANNVAIEDCQEVVLSSLPVGSPENAKGSVVVRITEGVRTAKL